MILGELNFRTEARYTEMFRRRAKNYGEGITAPKIYFEYCSERVLVSELVSGVWMWELMAAVDQNDKEFLEKVAGMGIEPKSIASKLINVMHRDVLEEMFFHADPHPANIVVQPNNGICFIDFGAVGRFSTQTRNTWRELNCASQERGHRADGSQLDRARWPSSTHRRRPFHWRPSKKSSPSGSMRARVRTPNGGSAAMRPTG